MNDIIKILTFIFFIIIIYLIYSKSSYPHNNISIKKSIYGRPNLAKYIHIDLKGAPSKPNKFYKLFFNFLKNLHMGVKGVLIEYEDILSLEGNFAHVVHRTGYTKLDIKLIEKAAKDNDIEIIPLIQTFGHLEWILKLDKFKSYRDHPNIEMKFIWNS